MLVSKKTKIDILVTPVVTLLTGALLSYLIAPAIGQRPLGWRFDPVGHDPATAAHGYSGFGTGRHCPDVAHQQRRDLRSAGSGGPGRRRGGGRLLRADVRFLPLSVSAKTVGADWWLRGWALPCCRFPTLCATRVFGWPPHWRLPLRDLWLLRVPFGNERGGDFQRYGHLRPVGQIGVYTGWVQEIADGTRSAITAMDWIGLVLICFILPALLSLLFDRLFRRLGWLKTAIWR